jgi:hypothetical protein
VLRAGQTAELGLRANVRLEVFFEILAPDCSIDPVVVLRHPVAGHGRRGGSFDLRYLAWTNRLVDEASTVRLRFTHPRDVSGVVFGTGRVSEQTTVPVGDGSEVVDEATALFDPDHQALGVGWHVQRGAVWNSGPYFGAWWAFAPQGGLRARVGYEAAAPVWLLHSVSGGSERVGDAGRRVHRDAHEQHMRTIVRPPQSAHRHGEGELHAAPGARAGDQRRARRHRRLRLLGGLRAAVSSRGLSSAAAR